jgi:hypothetical protein
MTDAQVGRLSLFLSEFAPRITEFHHGDCVGADAEAHRIASFILGPEKIWVHPPLNEKKRAFSADGHKLPPKDYLERNHDIVDAATVVFATPKTQGETLRSGTWATVRYAQKQDRLVFVVTPDGEVWTR